MAPLNRPSTTRTMLNTNKPIISAENVIAGKNISFSKRKAENSPPKNGNFKRPALNDLTNDGKTAKIKSLIRNVKNYKPVIDVTGENSSIKLSSSNVPETRSKASKVGSIGVKIQGPFKGTSNVNPRPSVSHSFLKSSASFQSKPSTKTVTRTSIATRSSLKLNTKVKTDKTSKVHQNLHAVNSVDFNAVKSSNVLSKIRLRSSTSQNEETIRETSLRRSLRNHPNKSETSTNSIIPVPGKIENHLSLQSLTIIEEPVPVVKLRRSLRNNLEKSEVSTRTSEQNHVQEDEPKVSRRSSARLSLRKSLPGDKSTENGSLYISALEEINNSVKEPESDLKQKQGSELSEFDKELLHDPQQVSLYAMEIFDYLKSREAHFPISDYMPRQPHIDKKMRAMLVDWMVEVQENFELNHETLYLSVKLVDSYLSHVEIRRESLQLVGAAALFLSCKYDERMSPLIDEFEYVGDGAYDRNRLLTMEQSILKSINYELSFPISYSFLRRYARCARIQMPLLTLARYILELGLMEYDTITLSDSKQAAAALCLAFRMVKHSKWTDSLKYYTGYGMEDFKDVIFLFNRVLHQKPSSQLMTVRNKYSHELFFKVAETPLINDEDLDLNDEN